MNLTHIPKQAEKDAGHARMDSSEKWRKKTSWWNQECNGKGMTW